MNASELIAALTWRDVVDFVLLYLIVYAALRLLKGTRAVPVLVAVAALTGVAFAAREFELVAVAVLLEYFLEYFLIILLVVFHKELRRMLVRLGQRLLPQGRRESTVSGVGALISACERLCKARVGALFVLEGEFDVLDVCSATGKQIDATLQAETLIALAIPHAINTAHDGAVLIRDFQIERAGLVCPLTERTLDPRFGTRHRGAIGVSEETDALVIVLSEERGEIRAIERGEISEALTPEELAIVIYAWIDRPPPEKVEHVGSRADMTQSYATLGGSRIDMVTKSYATLGEGRIADTVEAKASESGSGACKR